MMPDLGGMTVNEGLAIAGLFEAFDKAVRRRDRAGTIEILQKVELTAEQAVQTADAIFADPGRYGY
jgi:hypothetical protein